MSIVMIANRRSAKTLHEFEEATGQLRRVRSSEHVLILEFEWGDLRIEPDPSQSESVRRSLNDCAGKSIAIFRASDGQFLVRRL